MAGAVRLRRRRAAPLLLPAMDATEPPLTQADLTRSFDHGSHVDRSSYEVWRVTTEECSNNVSEFASGGEAAQHQQPMRDPHVVKATHTHSPYTNNFYVYLHSPKCASMLLIEAWAICIHHTYPMSAPHN